MHETDLPPPFDSAPEAIVAPPVLAPLPLAEAAVAPPAPEVLDGQEHKLDPRSITAARVTGGIWLAVLAAGLLVCILFQLFTGAGAFWIMMSLGAGGSFLVLIALLSWFWPPLRYRYASYRVNDRGFFMKEGVVWRSVVTVPRSRVQHTDVAQGPLQRVFGIATLIVYTAGTEHAFVSLRGLAPETANAIRDFLIDAGSDGEQDDAV